MGLFDGWRTRSDERRRSAAEALTHKRIDEFWSSVGTSEPDLLGYAISPSLRGGPHWPSTRQAHRVVRRSASIIIATDGMSDPWDGGASNGAGNGFGMELFIDTPTIPDAFAGVPGDVSRIRSCWAFELIRHIGQDVAGHGGIVEKLERFGALSMELPGFSDSAVLAEQIPTNFVTHDDCIGVLLGAPVPDFASRITDTPLSPVSLVPIVLLTADELEFVRDGGASARAALVEKLATSPYGHRSDLQRSSVL